MRSALAGDARAHPAPMPQAILHFTLVVPDLDEALAFYTQTLDFTLLEDTWIEAQRKRWVLIAPAGERRTAILLAQPADARQRAAVGNQTGGRVGFFLGTDDFERDYARYLERGVRFVRAPVTEPFGRVAVFEDPWGNAWDLIEPRGTHVQARMFHSDAENGGRGDGTRTHDS